MRALVLGLILANLLYWIWASNIDVPASALAPALDPDLPSLELVPRPVVEVAGAIDSAPREPGPDLGDAASANLLPDVEQATDTPEGGSGDNTRDESSETPAAVSTEPGFAAPAASEPPSDGGFSGSTPAPGTASLLAQNLLAAVDPVANPARCAGVGPFITLRQASEAAAIINEAGLTTSQRVEESQVWVGHWVHLPSYPSRAAAIKVVEKLREQGINDIYIEPSGELKNTISLGLFTKLESAETRAGLVRKLGDVKPQIRNRSRDGLVYWIDVSLDAGVSLDISTLPHNPAQELELKSVDCPPPAADG